MARSRSLAVAALAIAAVTSCGRTTSTTTPTTIPSDDQAPPVDAAAVTGEPRAAVVAPGATAVPSRAAPDPDVTPRPGRQAVELDQPAVWPAADVVFATPDEAAASFVSEVLGVEPVLGDFMAGDSRSGEIQVFSPGEVEGAELLERGLLGLRMIGPTDGWFVIAVTSQGIEIDAPDALARVPAGPLTMNGRGRGFEGTLVVTAFRAGDADDVLDQEIAQGGPFESLEPFTVTLDLSAGEPGDVIALMVRGDTGLDGDPGDVAAMPIVIADVLPPTR